MKILKQAEEHILGLALLPLGGGVGIDVGEHELLQGQHGLFHLGGLADQLPLPAGLDGVPDQGIDTGPVGKAQHPGDLQRDVHGVDNASPQGVLDVVVDIGDVVGQPDELPLQGGGGLALGVAQDAVPHLPGEVEPLPVLLQPLHHPHRLPVVGKPSGHQLVQGPLPRVSEGGVAQVVAPRRRLGQVLVQGQGAGDGPGDAAHLQGVGHAGAVVVPLGLEEHLGLVLQPPEGLGVDNPVHIPLEGGAHAALLLRPLPAPAPGGAAGPGGEQRLFPQLELLSQCHPHLPPLASPEIPYNTYTKYLPDFLFADESFSDFSPLWRFRTPAPLSPGKY